MTEGAFYQRDQGVVGAIFLFKINLDGWFMSYVDVYGPEGWNGGKPFECPWLQPYYLVPRQYGKRKQP